MCMSMLENRGCGVYVSMSKSKDLKKDETTAKKVYGVTQWALRLPLKNS